VWKLLRANAIGPLATPGNDCRGGTPSERPIESARARRRVFGNVAGDPGGAGLRGHRHWAARAKPSECHRRRPDDLLNAGIGPILALSNLATAVGNGAEGLIAAVQSGNPVNVANAVIDGVAGLAGAAINSVIDPNSGLVAAVLNLRNVIAQALGAPVAAVTKVAGDSTTAREGRQRDEEGI
jgi:hypothetical protein